MKIKTVLTHFVDDSDLDAYAQEIYGRDLSFVAAVESGNDSSHEINVDGKPLDEYYEAEFEQWKAGEAFAAITTPDCILNDLARRGLIPTGKYIVSVCW